MRDRTDDGFDDDEDEDDRPRRRRRRDEEDYEEPHRGGLLLALGIVGIVFCPVVSPVAWIMSNGDLRAIDDGRMDPEGKSNTQAGKILGIVGTVLLLIQGAVVVLYIGIIAVVAANGGLK